MKKRILSLFLSLCMVLTLLPVAAGAADIVMSGECGADGDNLTWTLDSDGLLTISGTGEMRDYDWGASPFSRKSSIKTVVIERGVTSIGASALSECFELTSIAIPDTVTIIRQYALSCCKKIGES